MQELIASLRKRLEKVVKRGNASCLLFSGGLDTSILVSLNPDIKAITVSLASCGEDIHYAGLMAKNLKLEHYQRTVSIDQAIEAIPNVIKILKSFDPAIPNDLVVYFGLKYAKELGADSVMTGDGADELFAGYSFMKDMSNLKDYIHRISQTMRFNSNELGEFFNIDIKQPYLDKEIIELALDIPVELKIRGENETGWGKWILRKTFADMLPAEIIWQDKRPLEYGSGMRKLRDIISARITDKEFKKNSCPVKFINKEHLYYYRIFKDVVGKIPRPKKEEKACFGCGAGMKPFAFHCRVCGNLSDWRLIKR